MKSITHLTSVHPRYDTRIFFKECKSLTKIYSVHLIVADSKGDEIYDGVNIYDVGKEKSRLKRVYSTTKKILNKAISLDSDLYHLHDPELIPIGLKLKKLGKNVVFDMHENIPLQIKDKKYIPRYLRGSLSYSYKVYEKFYLQKFDAIVLAENSYKHYYNYLSDRLVIVLNMPNVDDLKDFKITKRVGKGVFYIGGISNGRGLDVTIEAIKKIKKSISNIYMHYIGNTYDNILETIDIKDIEQNIKFYGSKPLYEGMKISKNCIVGLSILKPIENYKNSYSTKIFEYMAIGLPVITSDFKLYKDVIEKYDCGICIDPLDANALADAIMYIVENPKIAQKMGENGILMTEKEYNWDNEEKKLFKLYESLLNE